MTFDWLVSIIRRHVDWSEQGLAIIGCPSHLLVLIYIWHRFEDKRIKFSTRKTEMAESGNVVSIRWNRCTNRYGTITMLSTTSRSTNEHAPPIFDRPLVLPFLATRSRSKANLVLWQAFLKALIIRPPKIGQQPALIQPTATYLPFTMTKIKSRLWTQSPFRYFCSPDVGARQVQLEAFLADSAMRGLWLKLLILYFRTSSDRPNSTYCITNKIRLHYSNLSYETVSSAHVTRRSKNCSCHGLNNLYCLTQEF